MFTNDIKFWQKAVVFHPVEKHKFLTLRRSLADESRPGLWDLSGGNVDFGELAEIALPREIREETVLEVVNIRPIWVHSRFLEKHNRYELFIGYMCEAVHDRVQLSAEHIEFKWVTKEEFLQLESASYLMEMVQVL